MDKKEKQFRKLNKEDRKRVREIIDKIKNKDTKYLDIRKLKGFDNMFRVRKGRIRIIFRSENNLMIIDCISIRGDAIYKKL
ncbi:plasmid stabilization protein [Candidatus Wolfebacteria bacterium]|nr:MAG: plasmid stabilization protein [Candidatus Wolfebacteria bacterium]